MNILFIIKRTPFILRVSKGQDIFHRPTAIFQQSSSKPLTSEPQKQQLTDMSSLFQIPLTVSFSINLTLASPHWAVTKFYRRSIVISTDDPYIQLFNLNYYFHPLR